MMEFAPERKNVLAKLPVLSSSQAVEYCGYLLGALLAAGEFLEFADNFKINGYLRHCDLWPLEASFAGSEQALIPRHTLHEVIKPWVIVLAQCDTEKQQRIMLEIPLSSLDAIEFKTTIDGIGYYWQPTKNSDTEAMEQRTPITSRELYYLPQDIEALAQKILSKTPAATSNSKPKPAWGWKDGKQPNSKEGDCLQRDLVEVLINWHKEGRERPTAAKIATSLECFSGAAAGGFKYRDTDSHSTVKEFTYDALGKRIKKLIG